MDRQHIIIIGAGAAGLIAARELSAQHKVTILEARETTGGRMHTIYRNGEKAAEMGAEFVHGELPITLGLLKEAGLSYHLIYGKMFHVEDGKWSAQREMIVNWDELIEQMGKVTGDMTMQAFLDQYYPGDEHTRLREGVKGFVQGFDLADVAKVSIKYLYNEWINESDKNFRIEKGYSALVDFLVAECTGRQCEIVTGATVTHINWAAGNVHIVTANGASYTANKVIITVPLGVLQGEIIAFSPALPDYMKAVNDIGWGTVIKPVLTFKTPFWEKKAVQAGFILGDTPVPTWWTQLPDRVNTLTGWLGGPPAIPHIKESNEQLLELALSSVAALCDEDIATVKAQLISSHIANWAADPHVAGSYSYGTPATAAAQAVLNAPVDNTLYFAGEALYNGTSPGTVEAAFSTGIAVAAKIKNG